MNGYLPKDWTVAEWETRRERDPKAVERAARASMAAQVRAMLDFYRQGVPTLDYGNNIRQMAKEEGVSDAFDFHPASSPPISGRYSAAALDRSAGAPCQSDPEDIYRTDERVKELLPDKAHQRNGPTPRQNGSGSNASLTPSSFAIWRMLLP